MTEKKESARERERATVGVSRRGSPVPAAPAAWDPFERVYTASGTIDREYAGKRLPVLIDLLRRHPRCFPIRVDVDRLGEMLLADDAVPVRDAANQEAFEAALRGFSERHLHELVDTPMQQTLGLALVDIARDEEMTRRDRAGAALGVALLSLPPDSTGLRGRGVLDLVLRVTMEEQTAQQNLRTKARETEGGLPPEVLTEFWEQYPALRWQHEERYRREVTHVLKQIEADQVPPCISIDLALRGASKILAAVAVRKREGGQVEAREAEEILKGPFVADMFDEGPPLIVARWNADLAKRWRAEGADEHETSDERRAVIRTLAMASRIVGEHGPGTDVVLFYLYMRAVVHGHYYVRDEDELAAAKTVFGPAGIDTEGTLTYAAHLAARGEPEARHRVLIAALELWPDDAAVRAAVEAMGLAEEEAARKARLGPRYEEADATGETGEASSGDASA